MGAVSSNPALTVSDRYRGHQAARYFREHFESEKQFGRRIQSEYFRPFCGEGLTLLDFGCGDGTILRSLPAKAHFGIEVNPRCIEKIRVDNETTGPQLDVRNDIRAIDDDSIDVVISNHALEHTLQPAETLIHLKRVLRRGGTLVLVTPFDDWRLHPNRAWRPDDKDNHLFTWSPLNIGNLVHEAGFAVDHSRLVSRAWSPKLFWIHRRFGGRAFAAACRAFAWVKNRREVFTLARKP